MNNVGLRELTPAEIELVSGGTITDIPDGGCYFPDPWEYLNDYYNYYDFYDYGAYDGMGGGSSVNTTVADATEGALQITEAKHNVLEDLLARYGSATQIQLADGSVHSAAALLSGVDQVTAILQAGMTVGDVTAAGANAQNALNFLFGVTAAAITATHGSGAILADALGFGTAYAAGHILEWMEAIGALNPQLAEYFNERMSAWTETGADVPPDANADPIDMIRGMFGWAPFEYDQNYNIP